jgi:hypothetical protein
MNRVFEQYGLSREDSQQPLNVDALIQKGASNEAGQVYGDGCDASGEAFLSLDSEDEQKVLLLANPKGGVNFVLTNNDGNSIQSTVVPEGPKLTMKKGRQTVGELPDGSTK